MATMCLAFRGLDAAFTRPYYAFPPLWGVNFSFGRTWEIALAVSAFTSLLTVASFSYPPTNCRSPKRCRRGERGKHTFRFKHLRNRSRSKIFSCLLRIAIEGVKKLYPIERGNYLVNSVGFFMDGVIPCSCRYISQTLLIKKSKMARWVPVVPFISK